MDKNTGIIFSIQKFSIDDGPGIRTVVFFKGCPLRCKWCSNPESQLQLPQILWENNSCVRCQTCVQLCPASAISFEDNRIKINHTKCNHCNTCVSNCPQKALTSKGEYKTVEEIMDVIMQDQPFYEESGGGVTLSGGEFLNQPDFSIALLKAAKEKGLHTCCETTGYAKPEVFQEAIKDIDLILFDVKHWNSSKHMEYTGVTTETIINNLTYAIQTGKDVLPRIPVIPKFNDSLDDAYQFAQLLKEVGATTCQLLPFHQFGEKKYGQLGLTYAYENVDAYHKEDLEEYKNQFIQEGIEAFF